ncbi:rhodanese-like domain-containing protein [Actinoplanes sp. NEAU-A12]|uniref:Rhodanese-like domain-containing protein n=1 Tax=Actinoplanes sandaracinus TaxID=3045177 RepID=A0ABT6WS76_9ACTN|nr:rhodanese-like domain-containing protein [Actinoplanes sandaracinus]MDI6102531.1 rhodanese-like domain-containing protein [Actinoplanes sandaracinus]
MTGPLLSPADLVVRREHGDLVILDATVALEAPRHDGDHRSSSGRPGWEQAHIPGSRHADLLHDLSDPSAPYHFARPSAGVLAARLAERGVRDGVPVVAYDRAGGIWAARLWWLLDWLGVEAYVLDGGLSAWRAAGLPVTATATAEHADLVPAPLRTPVVRDGRWVGREDLKRWLAEDVQATVLCALSPEAYAGEVPTRYSRRGHIPGTGNVPARSLLGPDGRFRPEPELRRMLGDLLADPAPIWLYCGGGISAATLGLALTVLGRDDVALYDGSLQEWSADPELPIELGR